MAEAENNRLVGFKTVPVGSLLLLPKERRDTLLHEVFQLPDNSRKLLFSTRTSAFIRGLAKSYNIPLANAPYISLLVLQYFIGKISIQQLYQFLTDKMKLVPSTAQALQKEIESELVAPVMMELNEFWKQKKAGTASNQSSSSSPATRNPQPPAPATKPQPPKATPDQPQNLVDLRKQKSKRDRGIYE